MPIRDALLKVVEPRRFKKLSRDHRGYVIPWSMMPDSQITLDTRKMYFAWAYKRCGICGETLDNKKWFLGGHVTARNRVFTDPAMHEECARYAVRVCPFMLNRNHKYQKKRDDDVTVFKAATTERSETTVLSCTTGYKIIILQRVTYLFANRWTHLEHWIGGKQVEGSFSREDMNATIGDVDPHGKHSHLVRTMTLKELRDAIAAVNQRVTRA